MFEVGSDGSRRKDGEFFLFHKVVVGNNQINIYSLYGAIIKVKEEAH